MASFNDFSESALADLVVNPLKFIKMCWPTMKIYGKQRDILHSIRDNSKTFVHAANQMGKTRVAALAALHFYVSRSPARVIATSASESQLKTVLWNEMLTLVGESRIKFPFDPKELSFRKIRQDGTIATDEYCIGYVTRSIESFQGHHLDGTKARILAIFDEASAIADEFYKASESWAHRTLVISNPMSTQNFLYENCRAGDMPDPSGHTVFLRKIFHIDGLDSPNVQVGMEYKRRGDVRPPPTLIPGILSYHEYVQREASWRDNAFDISTRLHGHFYTGEKALLYPDEWLELAFNTKASGPATSIGVDVAMGGRDLTVWVVAGRSGVIDMIAMDTPNTMEIPGRTIRLMQKYKVPAKNVAMDAGGGGKQIADRMAELGHRITLVAFGENAGTGEPDVKKAADYRKSYKNRRAELYGALRKVLDPANPTRFGLPRDPLLRQELVAMPLLYESDGRMVLPPKERGKGQGITNKSLREILGRSPDRADALALAAWMVFTRAGPLSWSFTEKTWERAEVKANRIQGLMEERMKRMMAQMGN